MPRQIKVFYKWVIFRGSSCAILCCLLSQQVKELFLLEHFTTELAPFWKDFMAQDSNRKLQNLSPFANWWQFEKEYSSSLSELAMIIQIARSTHATETKASNKAKFNNGIPHRV